MSKHYASAQWSGDLTSGNGKFTLQTSGYTGSYKFTSRFEDDKTASSPEELIGAAHASCFSMALAHALKQAGHEPITIDTVAAVTLTKSSAGFSISEILLKTKGKVGNIDKETFIEIANNAKVNCPVSKVLTGTDILLEAELLEG